MKGKVLPALIVFILASQPPGLSQETVLKPKNDKIILDSLSLRGMVKDIPAHRPEITFSRDQAINFLQKTVRYQTWKNQKDPLRKSIDNLVFETLNQTFDSTVSFLRQYRYDSIGIPRDEFFTWEPLRLKIPGDSIFTPEIRNVTNDSVKSDSVKIYKPFYKKNKSKEYTDTTILVMVDTLREVTSSRPGFPFRFYRYPYQSDSIKAAVDVLLNYMEIRDSSEIKITGSGRKEYLLWLNSQSDKAIRFWLRNDLDDSVTVWIGTPARNTIGLYLEQGVSFRRPSRQGYVTKADINLKRQDKSRLVDIQKIQIKQEYWKYHTEAAFILNQALLTNWVKGGENSISTTLDITYFADYLNKPMLISSNNFARIKYGLVASETDGIRKNLDLLETNSKINHKAFGKFDFSGIMLFKTQISRGYSYPNDSVPVSKFLNPAVLTLGFGLDYKPEKQTSINFSPFSYKATFVPDTAVIDQTKYGVAKNKKALHEPGASLMVSNEFRPFKFVSVLNRLQLFTNYKDPLNIDVDWEMILKANINWFTEVRLNTHLIYDDNTKTPVYDKDHKPVIGEDGLPKKSARVQFKELFGLSFAFRF